jgi:RND family efflux transporter MFP subunit
MSFRVGAGLIVLPLLAVALAGCKPENKFIPPPPAEVSVAKPLQQKVVPYLVQTGNTQAYNTVDLVARVEGFLTEIKYTDGAYVDKDTQLFQIDPTTFIANVKQAEAQLAAAKAALVQSQAEFTRQDQLLRQNVTAQNTWDIAKAKRDSDAANVDNQTANLAVQQANLGYTKVAAPFNGVVSRHLVSVGELVGNGVATKLSTIVQLDPIYVYFNLSEQDVLNIRKNLPGNHRLSLEELSKIEIDIGLMNEEGYPHKGHLDYVSPEIDNTTGTIQVRGVFSNADRALLPGFFVRVRVPTQFDSRQMVVVPNRIVSEDQSGKYVLVVNKDDVVEQRRVKTGQMLVGNLRAITEGLSADDIVVVSTSGRAIPGNKIKPKMTTIQAPPAQ